MNTPADCAKVALQATSGQSKESRDFMIALRRRLKSVQGPNVTIGICATGGFWYEVK